MSVFLLGSWEIKQSGDKQIVWTTKQFSGNLFVPCSDSFPMNPEYTHSLYLQCFHQRQNSLRKVKKFKFNLVMGTYNLFWCKSRHMWFAQLSNYLLTVLIENWIENFRMVQWRRYYIIVNIIVMFSQNILCKPDKINNSMVTWDLIIEFQLY